MEKGGANISHEEAQERKEALLLQLSFLPLTPVCELREVLTSPWGVNELRMLY